MSTNSGFPNAFEGIIAGGPPPSHAYYNFLRRINDLVSTGALSAAEANALIAALTGRVDALEEGGTAAQLLAAMYGTRGIDVLGNIASGVEIRGPDLSGIQSHAIPGRDGEDGADSFVPGPRGQTGVMGPQGMPGLWGEDGADGLPGPPGAAGATGATGPAGADGAGGGMAGAYLLLDTDYPDPPIILPPAGELDALAPFGVQGDILYRGASSWARLPAGTAGYLLSANGAGANPGWINPSGTSDGYTYLWKTADETRSSNAVLADDSTLTVALAAGTVYYIDMEAFIVTANAVMDYKFKVNYTGTLTSEDAMQGLTFAGSAQGTDIEQMKIGQNIAAGGGAVAAGTFGSARVVFRGPIKTNTAGTFSFQWAQNTSDGANIIVRAGSYLKYRLIA